MTVMKDSSFVHIDQLTYSYDGPSGPIIVFKDLSLNIDRGEFVSLLGPSGSGKSTLMNLLGGLERPTSGFIHVNNCEISSASLTQLEKYRQAQVAFVFQFFNLLPTLTAYENVLISMEAMENPPKDPEKRAHHFLDSVGLRDKINRFPSQLSGGEQQRVAIARALAKNAPLILADEPTGNLDEETATQVIDLFVKVQAESGAAMLLITHDRVIASRAARTLQLAKGSLQRIDLRG